MVTNMQYETDDLNEIILMMNKCRSLSENTIDLIIEYIDDRFNCGLCMCYSDYLSTCTGCNKEICDDCMESRSLYEHECSGIASYFCKKCRLQNDIYIRYCKECYDILKEHG